MIINLREIFENLGSKEEVCFDIPVEETEYINQLDFASPLSVSGVIKNKSAVITFSYTVKYELHLMCDRCLSQFDKVCEKNFSHILSVSSESGYDDEDDVIVTGMDDFDVTECVITDILLDMPSKILCKEDCKGLCFNCGANLNEGECSCNCEE